MSDDKQITPLSNLNLERVFRDPVDALSDKEVADAWSVIDAIEEVAKLRKAALRLSLLARVEAEGKETKNGSYAAEFDGIKVIKERRIAKLPDTSLVESLIKEAGLEYDDAFTPKRDWSLDPSKVDFLVKCGKLPGDKLEASKKVTWALKVKPGPSLDERLEDVKKQLMPPE